MPFYSTNYYSNLIYVGTLKLNIRLKYLKILFCLFMVPNLSVHEEVWGPHFVGQGTKHQIARMPSLSIF
ncbi:uncharacterized protein DS421_10g293050 [Arachis hypogaea]|nr:uncharacterized protein DS421_10g293050 [Arachis hypogaea]